MTAQFNPLSATHIEVDAGVRYWEDAVVNGIVDADGLLIFGRDHSAADHTWRIRINLAEGRVEGWPNLMHAAIHYKICDAGLYWLTDADGNRIAKWKGHYVPSEFLCHGDSGHGKYVIFNVLPGGQIEHYQRPQIDIEQWASINSNRSDADRT